jgi:AhpD family alkylhydroperoxidase
MKKTMKLTTSVMVICIVVIGLSAPLLAQESPVKKAETEMEAAFGTVPVMFKVFPAYLRAGAWEWFKAASSPDAAIPAKYRELIKLGVAAQIPCSYCVYAHITMAKMLGATDAEIQDAVASAAQTRHWSTVLNGTGVDLEEFKAEWDGILAHLKKQSEAK